MEFIKMVMKTLYSRKQKTHRCIEQTFGLWERERVGWLGRMALKHVYYQVRNESPVYLWYRIQDAWGWCTGMIQRDDMGWEVGGRFRIGNACTPVADSCQCMAKQYSIVKQNKIKIKNKKTKNKRVQKTVLGCNLKKRQNDLCSFPRQTIQYHGIPSLCPNQ